ncbi:MAG: hypothetical protein KAR19_01815 [Bacteroidales bacterium]|nr:hypothetical protein [Bacteroidales bacterium]
MTALTAMILLAVSCLKDMPESLPETLVWNPDVAFPFGEESFGLNWESGFDTLLLELDSITGLPEWIEALEVIIEGYMDFDLSAISENLDHLNRILFRVNIYNGFPNDVLAQAYFLDAGRNVIDSMLFDGAMPVPPGLVVDDGKIIQPSHARQDAVFDRDQIEPLQDATEILFRATILNPEVDTALIPYYPSYLIDVNIGAMLDLTLEF